MDRGSELERGRDQYAAGAWLDAYEALARADRRAPLAREDLELLGTAAYMVGFPGWKITDVEPSSFKLPKSLEVVMKPDEHWYRLRRE